MRKTCREGFALGAGGLGDLDAQGGPIVWFHDEASWEFQMVRSGVRNQEMWEGLCDKQ
jgi:hypothetical protein